MIKEKTTGTVYESKKGLKGCSWNAMLEEIFTGEELTQRVDNPADWFNHWAYLKALESRGKQVLINQLGDCVRLVIQ